MANELLHLADSEVSEVSEVAEIGPIGAEGPQLWIRFSAAAVSPSVPAGELGPQTSAPLGWRSGLSLRLTGVTLESLEPPLIGRIVFARLDLGGQHRTRLPIDEGMDRGPLHLELHFAQGAELRLRARSLQVRVEPGSRFTESMAC